MTIQNLSFPILLYYYYYHLYSEVYLHHPICLMDGWKYYKVCYIGFLPMGTSFNDIMLLIIA